MYLEHFRLECRPFDETPDHRFLYLSPQHSRALANIQFALTNRDSFVVISGEIGIGKTTLLNRVLDEVPNELSVARIVHTTIKPLELLQSLLAEFGIPNYKKNKVYLLNELREFFLAQREAGRQIAILVDEAQNLSPDALEELRLLTCMDLSLAKLISVVLLGQPDLNDLIDSPRLVQLRQRVRIRQHLLPLNVAETRDYIHYRVQVAGADADDIFSADTYERIFAFTGGVPRLINTLCDMALTACWTENESMVTTDRLDAVAAELGWKMPQLSEPAAERTRSMDASMVYDELPDTDYDADNSTTAERKAPRTVYGWLRQARPESEEFWVPILHLPFTVGRTANNRLQLRNPHISRNHAVIEARGQGLCLSDLQSRNGTFVNGLRINEAVLNDGDRISFGDIELSYHMRVESSALSAN